MISAGSLGIALGTAAGGPVGGAAGSVAGNELANLFGGGATDAARATREQWTLAMAQKGSPLAAAIILAAPSNVSGNEATNWRAEASQIPANILALAQQRYPGGYWPVGQPDFYTDTTGPTHTQIVAEVAAAMGTQAVGGAPATTPSGATSTTGLITGTGAGAQTLPTVTTIGLRNPTSTSSSYLPWIVGGVVVLLVVVFALRGRK